MKYKIQITIFIVALQLFMGCDSDSAPECFKQAGTIISYDVDVPDFNFINVSLGVELVIIQGDERKITIETGKNLKNAITAQVVNNELMLTNSTSCNWVRGYKSTTVYVTTPHLERIYSGSQFAVRSEGVLRYPMLSLQSGLVAETASGTFELKIDSQHLTIEDNQSAYYVISGAVENLNVNFYSGDARFDGTNLIAQKLNVFQRSSNDIIANPQQEVTGKICSTGNLILKNHPPLVNVEELYTGRVIYK
ncbi:hypothetical protein D3C87_191120 [compost metagenome]